MISSPPTQGRFAELDVLRAVSVLLVLGRHILIIPGGLPPAVGFIFLAWRRCGWIGVDFFFTLSGFLISGLLFREYLKTGSISPGRFLIRRGLKIYPAFYVFLIASVLLDFEFQPAALTARNILGEIFFLQNYVGALSIHTWSLAVEEHFYLLLLSALVVLCRFSKGRPAFRDLPRLIIGFNLFLLIARTYVCHRRGYGWEDVISYTHWRIDSLLFGVLLSYWYHFDSQRLLRAVQARPALIAAAGLLLIAPALFIGLAQGQFMFTIGFTLLYLGFGGLMISFLLWQSAFKGALLARVPWLASIGRNSYSIYLWHVPIYFAAVNAVRAAAGRDIFALEAALYVGGAIAGGMLMSRIIEQPVLALRDKLFPSKSGALPS
jgi:peptidoglycan/LPS O-acetylase OafA/YrhL